MPICWEDHYYYCHGVFFILCNRRSVIRRGIHLKYFRIIFVYKEGWILLSFICLQKFYSIFCTLINLIVSSFVWPVFFRLFIQKRLPTTSGMHSPLQLIFTDSSKFKSLLKTSCFKQAFHVCGLMCFFVMSFYVWPLCLWCFNHFNYHTVIEF